LIFFLHSKADGDLITLEPTKRRRWNSAKDEGDSRGPEKDVQPLELQEPVPSANAPVPSAKVQTPKSAPPEKVAITRTAPTRAEATVTGESQKTRVGKLSSVLCVRSMFSSKFALMHKLDDICCHGIPVVVCFATT
jgi:apoptotic chromatin condensation inducer in the nucleus